MADVKELTTEQKTRIDTARAQATAYVWGRQDAGESTRDTGYSVDFGNAYSFRMRQYVTEEKFFMPNIQGAFVEWRDTGTIK
jgi:hypothetical protein